jgi:drug/metabolite transporter (DMT)-like permease
MNRSLDAWINGFIGVAIFSASLPATRLAVIDLDPIFLTTARATIAGICAALLLLMIRQPIPRRADLPSLVIVALGVVLGFPMLTALALRHITSAHGIVYLGLLPLSTAIFGVLRAGERPKPAFWLFAVLGSLCVAGFALYRGTGASLVGDGLMLLAILVCGLGYAEGARLARTMGGWPVICWALVISLPIMAAFALTRLPDWSRVGNPALAGLAYVSLFSMLIGFFFWYRGLAKGGIAAIGQLQLFQPFLGLALAAGLLGEPVGWDMGLASLAVIGCVAGSRRFGR